MLPGDLPRGFSTQSLALAAGLRADLAVAVRARELAALCFAGGAKVRANLELSLDELGFGRERSRDQVPGQGAHVGTIQIQANTVAQPIGRGLAHTGIGARDARELTQSAGLDALPEHVAPHVHQQLFDRRQLLHVQNNPPARG